MRMIVVLGFSLLGACLPMSEQKPIDSLNPKEARTITPSQAELDIWQREFESGTKWRSDPCRLAHQELQDRLDVNWKGEPFEARRYTFIESNPEHPDWGSYVIRGYVDMSGRMIRYRVKVTRYKSIWYARNVEHYFLIDLPDERFEDDKLPPMTSK